jgi:hypothetical protein
MTANGERQITVEMASLFKNFIRRFHRLTQIFYLRKSAKSADKISVGWFGIIPVET